MRLRSFLVLLGCFGGVATFAAYIFRHSLPPFALLFFYVAACTIATAMRLNRGRALVYNSAFVFVALGLFEFYLSVSPPVSKYEVTYSEIGEHGEARPSRFYAEDFDLGYVILPKKHKRELLKAADGSITYQVKYSIDEHGLRQGSFHLRTPEDKDNAVWFFVDSFTFGQGVNDEDTLPQAFSRASGIRVINFGVPGYGPHQMLRALETDRPRMIERRDPQAIVYTMLTTPHMMRAAGHPKWDHKGPHYEVVRGTATYVGPFAHEGSLVSRTLAYSRIYAYWLDEWFQRIVTAADRQRFLAIVSRTRELSMSKYHAPFFVVLWDVHLGDDDWPNAQWIAQRLEQSGIPTLRLSVSLPELQSDSYYNPPHLGGHPTGQAYASVSNALALFLKSRLPSSVTNAAYGTEAPNH
jgi:hypothetical protein